MHLSYQLPLFFVAAIFRTRARSSLFSTGLGIGLLFSSSASAQDRGPPTLRLGGVAPGGLRISATESWGAFDFNVTNLTDTDRPARAVMFFVEKPEVQYGRDLWVPAHSTLATWMLVGPAAVRDGNAMCEIEVLLYDRSGGIDRRIEPEGEERVRSRVVLYRKREPYSAIMLDDIPPEEPVFGRLPQEESTASEAVQVTRIVRSLRSLSDLVSTVSPGALPPSAEAFDGIDLLVLASGRIAHDPVGMRALRQWLEQGGRVWVMLDMVELDAVAPLLGDVLDFQVVDRVDLTHFSIETRPSGKGTPPPVVHEHERPVEFVRVLVPQQERAHETVDGWPVWFTRKVGRGKVVFTTLGSRAWYQTRKGTDKKSPFPNFPNLPMPKPTLEVLAEELHPAPEEAPFQVESFGPLLSQEIGYAVASQTTVVTIFGCSLLAALTVGFGLRRSKRPEFAGWVGPVAALAATIGFVLVGASSRRESAPTVSVAQVVNADSGADETPIHGLLAVYIPDSGPVEMGAEQGGFFDLDMAGVKGRTRRFLSTDMDSWHMENLSLPAGLRFGPFTQTVPNTEPITAVAHFGRDGVEGKLTAGPFKNPGDAILSTPNGRSFAVHLRPDGSFSAGGQDILPTDQFLAGAVLNDRQQRRQEIYREFLKRPAAGRPEGRNLLLAWADPVDMHMPLIPEARKVGSALLVTPLQLESSGLGERVTIPGPLNPYQRIIDGAPSRPTLGSNSGADMHLRFQLPRSVLPFKVEQARLLCKISAATRSVTIAGRADAELVELHRVESPLDPIQIEIAEERLLRLDKEGGLHLNVSISDLLIKEGAKKSGVLSGEEWTVEFLELEVIGRTEK
jgi:hypothetical protein